MSAFFVTATGTDIGKTFVTAGLLRARRARALKPIVSGYAVSDAETSDPGVLLAAMGEALTPDAVAGIAPWRFAAPLSPDMAAAREGRKIDFDALLDYCRSRIAQAGEPLFIEGVGGVMVPLDAHRTVLDWMVALELPLVLVTGSYLGAISHTLTALRVVQDAGLAVAALVVNETAGSAVPFDETLATLGRFCGAVPTVPLVRNGATPAFDALWHVLSRET